MNHIIKQEEFKKDNVKFSWIKKIVKDYIMDALNWKERLRKLSDNKKKIILKDYQILYEYYKFGEEHENNFDILNGIDVGRVKSYVRDWVYFYLLYHIFPEDMIHAKLYYNPMKQYKLLKPLVGIFEEDKEIITRWMKDHVLETFSSVRGCMSLLETRVGLDGVRIYKKI